MLRFAFALLLVVSVQANRIQLHKSKTKSGASCDDLEITFRNRLAAFQRFLDENPDLDAVSRATQLRVMMRTYGIIRPLRRARTCAWVVDDDSAEIEQARDIVQVLLAGNPCAEAARSEVQAGTSAQTPQDEIRSVQRALTILSSESCEVGEVSEETAISDGDDVDAEISNAEHVLQDSIDELEDSVSREGAFIQTDSNTGGLLGFMRGVGTVFLVMLLVLVCIPMFAVIGGFIASALLGLSGAPRTPDNLLFGLAFAAGGLTGGVLGIGVCFDQLFNQLMPRLCPGCPGPQCACQ